VGRRWDPEGARGGAQGGPAGSSRRELEGRTIPTGIRTTGGRVPRGPVMAMSALPWVQWKVKGSSLGDQWSPGVQAHIVLRDSEPHFPQGPSRRP
jgi:hypothetical protein